MILEFMGEHPILTVIVLWMICETIVSLVKAWRCNRKEDES